MSNAGPSRAAAELLAFFGRFDKTFRAEPRIRRQTLSELNKLGQNASGMWLPCGDGASNEQQWFVENCSRRLRESFAADTARPLAIGFPDSANCGEHATWPERKAAQDSA
jgi:hypothetical protein